MFRVVVESQESEAQLRKQMPETSVWSFNGRGSRVYLEEKVGKEGEKLKMLSYVTKDLF